MNKLVLASKDGDIGILTVNNPPVNALSPGVPEGIVEGLKRFESDERVRAIILIGRGRTFIAGADIREVGKIIAEGDRGRGPGFNEILSRIESSSKPVIAAIHGTALGGGLETAMACRYRVAVPAAQVGQPEVKLGLIPRAGGTQRLPGLQASRKRLRCARRVIPSAPRTLNGSASSTRSSEATCSPALSHLHAQKPASLRAGHAN